MLEGCLTTKGCGFNISYAYCCRHFPSLFLNPPHYRYLTYSGIPTFSSHEEHRRHILIHTAAVFRDFARKGFTEGMSGHISVRDPEFPDYIWMNPLGRHFGMMTAGDLICLDLTTGKVVGGNRVCTRAWLCCHYSGLNVSRPRRQMQRVSSSIQRSTRPARMYTPYVTPTPMPGEPGLCSAPG
jgi:hypothetical protein